VPTVAVKPEFGLTMQEIPGYSIAQNAQPEWRASVKIIQDFNTWISVIFSLVNGVNDMALNRKFQVTPVNGKYQVQQFGGWSIWQNRGAPFDTSEEANADIDRRLELMGPTRSDNRSWAHSPGIK